MQRLNGDDRKVASFLSIFPKRDFFRVSNALIYKGAEASEQSTGFLAFVQKKHQKTAVFCNNQVPGQKKKKPRNAYVSRLFGGELGIRTLGTFLYTAFRVVSQIGIPRFFDGILRPPAPNRSLHIFQGVRVFSLIWVRKPLRIRIIRHFLIFLAIFPRFLAYSRENAREKSCFRTFPEYYYSLRFESMFRRT